MEGIRQVAKKKGMDGVIIRDNNITSTLESNEGLGKILEEAIVGEEIPIKYHTVTYNVLSAIGIKYINNMDYVKRIVKKKEIVL